MGVIIYNNIPSTDARIVVETIPNYEIATRQYDIHEVPGRGNIVVDKKTYSDVVRKYNIAVEDINKGDSDFGSLSIELAKWLHGSHGYQRLEDTYLPDYYHLAYCSNDIEVTNLLNVAGRATIEFTRKPERYLKTGEKPILLTKDMLDGFNVLYNPTGFESKPKIIVKSGTGDIMIGNNYTINVLDNPHGDLIIDSVISDCYCNGINQNENINLVEGRFPTLSSKETIITFNGSISAIEIIPNWWTL